jgi:outer membrane protein TolC
VLFDRAAIERLRAARDTAIAAGLDAERAGDLAAATAGAAWLRLAGAQETVTAREQDSVTAFALLEIARSQVDAGTAPRIDRTRSETRAAAVRVDAAVARNERDRARLDLARAVDLPPGTPVVVSADAPITSDTFPTDIDAAVALARSHRVDLAAERARQVAMQRSLTAIKSEFIPSIAASGFVQTSGTGIDSLAGTWNIGVGLSWSLFDGFRRERRVDEQRLRLDAESRRLHDLEAQIETDVREAALDLASARDQLALANDRVRLAEEELSEARERFAAGVTGSVETTNAQSEVAAAHDALIQARLSAGAAQINAARAIGLLSNVH